MEASRFVGRVGGLALALGAGVVIVGVGCGLAAADAETAGSAVTKKSATTREGTAERSHSTKAPAAAAARAGRPAAPIARASASNNGVTVNPTVTFVEGVVQGSLNATSERCGTSCLTYSFVGSSNRGKLDLGTVPVTPTDNDPQSFTALPYATWLDPGGSRSTQTFTVRVSEVTDFDTFVTGLPVVGLVAAPLISLLQQSPFVGSLLAPIIGGSAMADIEVDVGALAPGDTPLAFTYDVVSFDGVKISTNFFPALGLTAETTAPTVLNGPGLGGAGITNPYTRQGSEPFVPAPAVLRATNYNLITWDPRGEHASGGVLQLDNPFYEGRDTSAIISWATQNTPAQLDRTGDPAVGMVGGSYGGGIELITAATDPRVDAIVPSISWNSLNSSLYPGEVFKSAWATVLLLSLVSTGARINNEIYTAVATGLLFNYLSPADQAALGSSGPTTLLNQLTAPTLLLQGTVDSLFPLAQSAANAERILANPYDTPVKMAWFCGGHGFCLDPVNPDQNDRLYGNTLAWLDQYVSDIGQPADTIPTFQWYDQTGEYYTSDLMPFQAGFTKPLPFTARGAGGLLPIIPVIGGSGPAQEPSFLTSFPGNGVFPTVATNAVNIAVAPNVGDQIVGAPQLTFDYQGIGNGKAVFAQLVDDATGRVVGNMVTAVPVTLDGQARTVTIPMQDIAYTVNDAADSMTLQIVAYASMFANSSVGVINISDVELDLPLVAPRAIPVSG